MLDNAIDDVVKEVCSGNGDERARWKHHSMFGTQNQLRLQPLIQKMVIDGCSN